MPLAIPLIVILAAFVALGSASLARTSSGGFIGGLGKQAADTLGATGWIARETIRLASHVAHALGRHFQEIEHAAASWVGALAVAVERVNRAALTFPFTVSTFAYWLVRHELPRLINAIPGAAAKVIRSTVTRVVRVERTIVKLPKLSRAQAKALIGAAVATYVAPYLAMLRWLRSHFHAITAVLPHTLPLNLPKSLTDIRKRLRHLERIGVGAIGVGALAMALGRLRLGWLRCRNVGRVGRRVCGMDASLLESLLLDSFAVLSVVSVVEFANDLRAVEDEALTIMGRLVREFPKV